MSKRKPNLVDFNEAGFVLDDKLRLWLEQKFPAVEADETLELFTDKARAKGWVYADWPAAFRNYIRNSGQYGGVAFKRGLGPEFNGLIPRARAVGFRMPQRHETASAYRSALDTFDKQQASSSMRGLVAGVIKRVPKE